MKWSIKNDGAPKIGQIGGQKMIEVPRWVKGLTNYGGPKRVQISQQKMMGILRQVKLVDKKSNDGSRTGQMVDKKL